MDYQIVDNSLTSFDSIMELIENYEIEEIINCVAKYNNIPYKDLINRPMGGYSKGKTSGAYYFVLKDLKENLYHYKWLYNMLYDDKSKNVYLNLLRYRILPAQQFLENAYDDIPQYFDKSIVYCDENEVFVDCGGFTGDTVESYIKNYKKYNKIYIYEPSSDNIEKCKTNISKYQNVIMRQCGVGEKSEILKFSKSGSASSLVGENDKDYDVINIINLDDDINEPVSFIKMDVECFEIQALIGAKNHIKNDTPKLAICVYHIVTDIWEIPRLIYSINKNYRFYIRHYEKNVNWETVIYAIPVNKDNQINNQVNLINEIDKSNKKIGVYAPSVLKGNWNNQQLTKDCGLIPYLLYKKFDYNAHMVGEKNGEYPSLEKYVKGLKMDFLQSNSIENNCNYINKNYKNMDIMVLYGPYPMYFPLVDLYKRLRPDGKIFLALDANSAWMDRIHWNEQWCINMFNKCDVIATSCKKMQKLLNIKWPKWNIEYIPNGFYNFEGHKLEFNFIEKENTILFVGRIGTEQKANQILLEAFAKIADSIPNWKIKLIGSIEPQFNRYIESYFNKFPKLKEKIIFAGMINDKGKLWDEYRRAKIFALTSIFEGGAPNVISEAQINGCYMISSAVDASNDIIYDGKCGQEFPINNIDKLSEILLQVCSNNDVVKEGALMSIKTAKLNMDWNLIIQRINYMLL